MNYIIEKMDPRKDTIQLFKDTGVTEIPEDNSSIREIITAVLQKYPDRWFTQKDFKTKLEGVEGVGHSNPYINNTLRKLSKAGTIHKETRGKRAFYRSSPPS